MNWRHAIFWGLVLGCVIGLALLVTDVLAEPETAAYEPWCGRPYVDGNIDDWTPYMTETYFAPLYQAGDPFNPVLAKSYLMYWTQYGTNGMLSVMVQVEAGEVLHKKAQEQWVKAGPPFRVVVDDTMPHFAYIGNGAWEATFPWPNGGQAALDIHALVKDDETARLLDTLTIKPNCEPTVISLASMGTDGGITGGGSPAWGTLFFAVLFMGLVISSAYLLVEMRRQR